MVDRLWTGAVWRTGGSCSTRYPILTSIYRSSRCHRSLREASPSGGADLAGGPFRCQFRQGRGAETTTGASPCGWAVLVGALVWRDMMMPPSDVVELQIREQQEAERREALPALQLAARAC